MTVVATLKDGRIIAKASISRTAMGAATSLSATITDLRKVENLLQVNLLSDANVGLHISGTSISGNVVGITVVPASGTTVSGEVIVVGF
jgi:hypothetical protein